MASARDIHSTEYHSNEQQAFRKWNQYQQYEHAVTPVRPAQSGIGLLPAHIPARDLTHNWVDIESHLRGIGANDVYRQEGPARPDSKNIPVLNLVSPAPIMMQKQIPQLKDQRMRYLLGGQTIAPRYEKFKL